MMFGTMGLVIVQQNMSIMSVFLFFPIVIMITLIHYLQTETEIHTAELREDFNKKNSKKSDIVTIRSGTYLPYLNGDIKISDICSKI